MFKRLGKNL